MLQFIVDSKQLFMDFLQTTLRWCGSSFQLLPAATVMVATEYLTLREAGDDPRLSKGRHNRMGSFKWDVYYIDPETHKVPLGTDSMVQENPQAPADLTQPEVFPEAQLPSAATVGIIFLEAVPDEQPKQPCNSSPQRAPAHKPRTDSDHPSQQTLTYNC